MDNNFKSGIDVIYLTSCALHGIVPEQGAIEKMDLQAVYNQAKRHKMLYITCMALEPYWDKLDKEIINEWRMSVNQAIKSSVLYSVEREKLFRFMDKNKISYLPLKGIILQDVYPKIGMRQMLDNDILIDINKRHLVREYMENNGYKVDMYGTSMHDVYMKPPIFNFEMHVYLVTELVDPAFYNYYLDIWQRLERPDKNRYEYRFSKEDFYLHVLVHAYKHFTYAGGIGLKPLADIFVYLQKYGDSLDRRYLTAELKKLRLTAFEKNISDLSGKIFDVEAARQNNISERLCDEEENLLKFFIDSGSFGSNDALFRAMIDRFANGDGKITKSSKVRYFLNRLFPTGVYIKDAYPFFHKHKYLIPALWIYRFFSKIFVKFKRIMKEIKFILKQK
ncbi:MAG: nucleotidyltransferase family protein [Clostridia bacterium]|nr:nucleotidyltransferase family protein [Clostridia bacterium]